MARVVLIVPSFPKLSESFIVGKFLGLLEQGWDVHVVCGQSLAAEWGRFPDLAGDARARRRVHVTWPERPRWWALLLLPVALLRCILGCSRGAWRYLVRGWRRFGPDILRRLYLDAELLMLQPDLVHFEFGALAPGRLYLSGLLGCKTVVSFRGYDLNCVGLEEPGYYDEVWRDADALHLLGEDLWQRAQKRGCPPDKPHALIAPAIDSDFFDPGHRQHTQELGTSDRPLRILSVGRLDWRKGYEYGLQAVRRLTDAGLSCEYRIVGDGDYLEAVAFARHQLGLESVMELIGARPRAEVKAQMEWADVFLHAAVSEGFCNAVLEAQAMMLPVVCSDAGGLPENVADGETGLVVPRREADGIAVRLTCLARDPSLRQTAGEAGRRRVVTQFEMAGQVQAFDGLYHRTWRGDGGLLRADDLKPEDMQA